MLRVVSALSNCAPSVCALCAAIGAAVGTSWVRIDRLMVLVAMFDPGPNMASRIYITSIAGRSSATAKSQKSMLSVQLLTYPAAKSAGRTIISDSASIGGSTDLMRDVEQPRSAMVEDVSPARVPCPEVRSGERQGVWGSATTPQPGVSKEGGAPLRRSGNSRNTPRVFRYSRVGSGITKVISLFKTGS